MPLPKRALLAASACLALAACTIEDGPIYDIPAREQARSLNLEIDRDGTPLILAQTDMYFSTASKRGEYDPLYTSINTQTSLFSKSDGSWKSHPFENLTHPWGYAPKWARDNHGGLHPLVWDRDRISLYSRAGTRWEPRIRRTLPDPGAYWSQQEDPHMWVTGDAGWQRLTYTPRNELIVMDENGVTARLDSGSYLSPLQQLQGPDWLGVVGRQETYSLNSMSGTLVWYRWNRDLAHAAPRKTVLDSFPNWATTVLSRSGDEIRLLAFFGEDSLMEWALRGERFERVAARARPWALPDSSSDPNPVFRSGGMILSDDLGCLHEITAINSLADNGSVHDLPGKPRLMHRTSCGPESDTVDLAMLAGGKNEVIVSQNTRVGPDGSVYLAVAVQEQKPYSGNVDWYNQPVLASRLGLASKRPGGAWVYETVASY